MKIDFVVLWVDDSDVNWQNEKAKYQNEKNDVEDVERYRDLGFFKYWFRGVEKFAPWVNKIYLVTSGHIPEWLNLNNDKLVLIKHEDYMPKENLPTFNSNAIEINIHRIKGLSEHFVLFNDDTYLNAPVTSDDFFKEGLPRDFGIYSFVSPSSSFNNMVFNDVRVINTHFSKYIRFKDFMTKFMSIRYGFKQLRTIYTMPFNYITGYYNAHLPSSFLKSTFEKLWDREGVLLGQVSKNKFRTDLDINQWLFRYWQIEERKFFPQDINFGELCQFNDIKKVIKKMENEKLKILCLNDTPKDTPENKIRLQPVSRAFEDKFPQKSTFEK